MRKVLNLTDIQWYDISRYKSEIYGFSILWIMLFHAHAILGLDYTFAGNLINQLIKLGNIGVEVFLFCSGIFLYFSYHNKKNLKNFICKRYLRLFYPVIIINLAYWIWKWIIIEGNVAKFICKLTMVDFWISGDQQIWFVSLIFVCYIFYPYIHDYIYESNVFNKWIRCIILVFVIFVITYAIKETYPDIYNKIEIGLTRIPVFVLGCVAGEEVYEKKSITKWAIFLVAICTLLSFYMLHCDIFQGMWRRYFFTIPGIGVTFILIFFLNMLEESSLIKQFLAFLGNISLNLYVAHITVIRLYKLTSFYEHKRLLHYAVILLISIIIGWLTEKIINYLNKK